MHGCTRSMLQLCRIRFFEQVQFCTIAFMQICTFAIVHKPVGRVAPIECCLWTIFSNANLPPEMKEGEGRDLLRFSRPRTPLRQRGFYATNRESIFSAWSTRRYRRRPWTTAETAGSHWAGSRSSYQPTATPARSGRKTECDPAFCLIFSHIRKEIRDDRHRRGAGRTDVGYPIRQRPALFCHRSVRLRHRYPGGE
jgi:hypothetical protein